MKGLFFSDLQLSNNLPYGELSDTGANSRLQDQVRAVAGIYATAIDRDVDFVVFAGDWFDSAVADPYVLKASASLLEIMDDPAASPTYLLSGNHDFIDRNCQVSIMDQYLEFKKKFKNITFLNRVGYHDILGVGMLAVPYQREFDDRALRELLAAYQGPRKDLLVLHSPVRSATLNKLAQTKSQFGLSLDVLQQAGYTWTVLGDFHSPQILARNIFYCGCPLALDFGDADDQKGCWIIDFGTGTSEFIPGTYPPFRSVVINSEDELEPLAAVKEIVGSYLRVISTVPLDWPKWKANFIALGVLRVYLHSQIPVTDKPRARASFVPTAFNLDKFLRERVEQDTSVDPTDKPAYTEIGLSYLARAKEKFTVGE